MHKKKVFISFDFDQDKALKDLLIGQAHNPVCPFQIIDRSLKEAAPEEGWEERARNKIAQADLVIVLVGTHTRHAPGVLGEIRLARRAKKKIVQLISHKNDRHNRVPGAGILYRWTWENIQKILS